jgi:hypothetical protein
VDQPTSAAARDPPDPDLGFGQASGARKDRARGVKDASRAGATRSPTAHSGVVTTPSFDSDPVFDFIVGRAGAPVKPPAAVGLAFVGCLLLAATVASGVIAGDVAVGAFVVLVAVLSWWAAPGVAVVVALVGFLFANGFALDTKGTLSWHGESDLLLLAALIGTAVTVSVMGNGRRLARDEHRQSEWSPVDRGLHN